MAIIKKKKKKKQTISTEQDVETLEPVCPAGRRIK